MNDLLNEYCSSLDVVRKLIKQAKTSELMDDLSKLNAMERDLQWSIEYMMTGFPPTIRSSRCISVDPQKVLIWFTTPHPAPILTVERTRQKILSALDILTHQEREAFLMVVGEGLSYREVAEMMGVRRSTVQCYVERAREKIKKRQKRSE